MDYQNTGIGSLPFKSIEEAINYSFSFDIPYLPQLPSYLPDEFMIPQSLNGINLDKDNLGKEFASWGKSLRRLEAGNYKRFKMQYCGAFCLIQYGASGVPAQEITAKLAKRLESYIRFFSNKGIFIQIFLDEPTIGDAAAFSQYYHQFFALIDRSFHKHIAIHCCGEVPWREILHFPFHAISFDASLHLAKLTSLPFLQQIEKKQIDLYIGAIPTDWEEIQQTKLTNFAELIHAISLPLHQLFISPACGHGLRSNNAANVGAKSCQLLSQMLREKHELSD